MGKCRIIEIDSEHINQRLIEQVVAVLNEGGIIAHPTDTTYAFGVKINNKKGVDELYRIKKKDLNRPLSFLCSNISSLSDYAIINKDAFSFMKKVLPGPYTFILPARKSAPRQLFWTNRKEIGLRVPNDPILQAVVDLLGEPLISTSAKLAGGDLMASPYDILDEVGHALDMIIDAGYIEPLPSTIINFMEEEPVLVRQGKGPLHGLVETE